MIKFFGEHLTKIIDGKRLGQTKSKCSQTNRRTEVSSEAVPGKNLQTWDRTQMFTGQD